MAFRNPYHLFKIPFAAASKAAEIRLAKKRALAEFELQDAASVEFDGVELGKSQVIEMFDLLTEQNHAEYYRIIHENELLNVFLTKEGSKASIPEDFGPLADDGYRAFIGEWLIPSLQTAVRESIEGEMILGLEAITQITDFFPRSVERDILYPAIQLIGRKVAEMNFEFKHLEGVDALKGKLLQLTADFYIKLLNSLPPNFAYLRADYAEALSALANHLHSNNTVESAWLAMMMEAALSLDIDAKTQLACVAIFAKVAKIDAPIRSMLQESEKNGPSKSEKGKKSGKYDGCLGCSVVVIIIVGIIWIFSEIAISCNPSNRYNLEKYSLDSLGRQEMLLDPGDTLFAPDLPNIPVPELYREESHTP